MLTLSTPKIAAAVVRHAGRTGSGCSVADEDVEVLVEGSMWDPTTCRSCRGPRGQGNFDISPHVTDIITGCSMTFVSAIVLDVL